MDDRRIFTGIVHDLSARVQAEEVLRASEAFYRRPGESAMRAEQRSGMTVFAVQDNGRGIAADDIPYVFEPFRRVGRQDVPGEGMGLAYVRTLVRRHGGDITCQSTLGVGTTFTFTIAHTLPSGASYA